ncbi:SDR family oxidoreductase [Actinophytocola sp.]|uniref:SDR family NAD(P)-dependent oxidoreductase n=1 Tax=Actinophytocola sp. TaxID=1872138 RepID=UPI0025BE6E2D|nr:SDR family oxidoreductase [Actinophytocola sp.]
MRLRANTTVLVTGSTKNLGRAAVLAFAEGGANVIVSGRSDVDRAEAVATECEKAGGRAIVSMGDMSVPADVERVVADGRAAFGSINVYVANAAIRPHQAVEKLSYEDWDNVLKVNLSSAFYLAHNIVPMMLEQGWGRILHTSGADGFVGWENRAHNVTAKAGIHGLTKALAKELGPSGVTANTVVPGAFDTTRDPVNYPNWNPHVFGTTLPVRRIGRPEEYGALCRFLGSDESGYISGQAIHISGGQVMV